jgi:tetratricopeptide (TPR) repeat protein
MGWGRRPFSFHLPLGALQSESVTEPAARNPFLDVDRLLESSPARPRFNMGWGLGAVLLIALFTTALAGGAPAAARQAVAVGCGLVMLAAIAGMSVFSVYTVRRLRAEHQRVEQIGELVQLRRWADAAMALELYLSQPAATPQLRVQALVFLAPVLARLERYEDAIAVQTYLIERAGIDPGGSAAMRVGRAMAMLHQDHLFDADRAISELRRSPAAGSAALALVELYRDVKTGHPAEAIELFEQKRAIFRDQLGHRAADAYALAARAYDLLGREADARAAFRSATLLAPAVELFRRYPEVNKLSDRFHPAPAPAEAA